MNNAKQETIADIVAEMREFADTDSQSMGRDVLRRHIQYFARRIESSAKREREAGSEAAQICGEIGEMVGMEAACKEKVADCNRLGNVAKMREALENCASMGEQIDNQLGSSEDTVYAFRGERCLAHNISECARVALASPPRNCDVGAPEEQSERFDAHCRKHMGCLTCPLREKDGGVPKHCELAWAQMPYEGEGEK